MDAQTITTILDKLQNAKVQDGEINFTESYSELHNLIFHVKLSFNEIGELHIHLTQLLSSIPVEVKTRKKRKPKSHMLFLKDGFLNKHIKLAEAVFTEPLKHTDPLAIRLISLARKEISYSPSTVNEDIFNSLMKEYYSCLRSKKSEKTSEK